MNSNHVNEINFIPGKIPIKNFMEFNGKKLNILILDLVNNSHEINLFIDNLLNLDIDNHIALFIVGENYFISEIKKDIIKSNLNISLFFIKKESKTNINEIFNICHIGLSFFNNKLRKEKKLNLIIKNYCLRGLPTITVHENYDLFNNLPFILSLPKNNLSIENIYNFTQKNNFFKIRLKINSFAKNFLNGRKNMENLEKIEINSKKIKKDNFIVQFYVYKNVHWPMFENLFFYLKTIKEIKEIIVCLPKMELIVAGANYKIWDKIKSLDCKIVAIPQKNVDITYIADTIAGKVYGCGKIVNLGHGTISKGYYFTNSVWTERENFADLICVPGNYAKNKLFNILNTKVVATGMPKLDKTFSGFYDKNFLTKKLNLNPNKLIFLYAPTFNIHLSSVFDFAERFKELSEFNCYFLIKLHGSTLGYIQSFYEDLAKKYKNFIYIKDSDISPYLGGSDIIISDVSSVFMEFMALNKPVILYNNPNVEKYHGFNKNDIEYKWRDLGNCINSFDELLNIIPLISQGDNKGNIRKQYANMLFSDLKGNACKNVWNETLEIMNSPKIKIPVFSIIINIDNSELFLIRTLINNIELYSVMPIELILNVMSCNEKTNYFIENLKKFNTFMNIIVLHKKQLPEIKENITGDYIIFTDNNVSFYRNFEYIAYKTFKNNKINAITGVTPNEIGSLNSELYLPIADEISYEEYSYQFINKYKGKNIVKFNSNKIDFIIVTKEILLDSKETNLSDFINEIIYKNYLFNALSLFYLKLNKNNLDIITQLYNNINSLNIQKRIDSCKEVLEIYYSPDFAEILFDNYINAGIKNDNIFNAMSKAVSYRFYDKKLKQKIKDYLDKTGEIVYSIEKDLEIIETLSKPNSIKNKRKSKILFYFFKNVHIPILIPIFNEMKKRDVTIGFSVMPYSPQIRAGFLPQELNIIKEFGVPIYDNPQQFNSDAVIIADSIYPLVKNCGKIIHVGHGVLSKGQYYCDTKIARREEEADLVCVPGEYHKKELENIISTKIIATGMAKSDKLFSKKLTKELALKYYNLPTNKRYILYAPTFNDELSSLPFWSKNINKIIPDDNTFLIIKLHGSTNETYREDIKTLIKQDKRIIYADRLETDITPFLAIADILISDVSSVMMEFAALDKPVVLFNSPHWEKYPNFIPENIDFKWRDFAIQVNNTTQLKIAIKRSFIAEKDFSDKRKIYSDLLFANKKNGNAANTVCNEVLKLISD